MFQLMNIIVYAILLINISTLLVNGERSCEDVKQSLVTGNSGGEHLNCDKKDLVAELCSSVTLSVESGDIGAEHSHEALALGSYVPLGVWEGDDTPIYFKEFVDGEMFGPYFLYWGTNEWFIKDNSIKITKPHTMKSNHCKFDKKSFEDCSGKKWFLTGTGSKPVLKMLCDSDVKGAGTTKTILIVVGVIAAVAIILILVVVVMRKRARRSRNI